MKVMKKTLILLGVITLVSAGLRAQELRSADRIESEKIAFFTRHLNLTPDEAKDFWPVYNELTQKRGELNKEKNEVLRSLNQNFKTMDDKEIEEGGDKLIELTLQEAELAKKYHQEFKKVLPPVKVIKLYQVEKQFRGILLEQLRNRRSELPAQRRQ